MSSGYSLKNLVRKSPFPCEEGITLLGACSHHLSGVLPGWGYCLCSLFSPSFHTHAHTHTRLFDQCTVKYLRELVQMRTASDLENAMWGDVERSWGTAQSSHTGPAHPGCVGTEFVVIGSGALSLIPNELQLCRTGE